MSDLKANVKPEVKPFPEPKKEEKKPPEVKAEIKSAKVDSTSSPREEMPAKLGELGAVKPSRFNLKLVVIIVLGIFTLGFAGAGAWLYLENQDLTTRIASLEGSAGTSEARVTELQAQVTGLQSKASDLEAESKSAAFELSFFVVPTGVTPGSSSTFSDLGGTLGGGGTVLYSFTTARGTALTIRNSKEANVDAALKPLLGTVFAISGAYTPGSRMVTITAVKGAPIEAPAPQ